MGLCTWKQSKTSGSVFSLCKWNAVQRSMEEPWHLATHSEVRVFRRWACFFPEHFHCEGSQCNLDVSALPCLFVSCCLCSFFSEHWWVCPFLHLCLFRVASLIDFRGFVHLFGPLSFFWVRGFCFSEETACGTMVWPWVEMSLKFWVLRYDCRYWHQAFDNTASWAQATAGPICQLFQLCSVERFNKKSYLWVFTFGCEESILRYVRCM